MERSAEARGFLNFLYFSFPEASRLWESGFSHPGGLHGSLTLGCHSMSQCLDFG